MTPVRLALVGTGDIALRAHLPAILARDDVALVALADVDERRLAAASRSAPAARTTTDAQDVLASEDVDAVIVATPAWVTAELVPSALAAGKAVLAEKPLAPTLEQQRELLDAPSARDRLQVGLTYRHHPAVDRLRELVADGAFGRPLYVRAAVCDERADPVGDPEHYARRRQTLEHGPPVVFDGIHACDRINYVLGEQPVELTAWGVTTSPDFSSANVNGAVLRYADASVVRLEVIWLLPALPASEFVVVGPRGRAVLDPPTFDLRVDLVDGAEHLPPPGDKIESCFARQLDRFVAVCRGEASPVPGIDDALAASTLCARIADAF